MIAATIVAPHLPNAPPPDICPITPGLNSTIPGIVSKTPGILLTIPGVVIDVQITFSNQERISAASLTQEARSQYRWSQIPFRKDLSIAFTCYSHLAA